MPFEDSFQEATLKEFDTRIDNQDEWETPFDVFWKLLHYHNILPLIDVCADSINTKCDIYITKKQNALFQNWDKDVWCNPPHSETEAFVRKAQTEWQDNNINILMIVPANAIGAHYFDYVFDKNCATYHRYSGRIKFLQKGRVRTTSRNGYFSVVWRKR